MSDNQKPPDSLEMPDPSRLAGWASHLSETQLEMARAYMHELLYFNRRLNLISAQTVGRVDAVHILDSIRAWALVQPLIKPGQLIHDFGSGNGLPGLLCAAIAPDHQFRLIDRDQRKMEFCKHVASKLKLKNVVVSCEDVTKRPKNSIEVGISRGFASVTKSLLLTRAQFKIGGSFFMMKGEGWSLELAEIPTAIFGAWKTEMIGQYTLPETAADFVVLQCRKTAE